MQDATFLRLMHAHLDYNGRVGDVRRLQQYPEARKLYAQAVVDLESDIIPEIKRQMNQLNQELGLSGGKIGQVVTLEELLGKDVALQQKQGQLAFDKRYTAGTYLSRKI